jgi:hypothetical protein
MNIPSVQKQPLPPVPVCPLCRQVPLEKDQRLCPQCLERAHKAKLDSIAEKVAIEVYIRMVSQERLSSDVELARAAWDVAGTFRAETARRLGLEGIVK